jgi:hypothetical protein
MALIRTVTYSGGDVPLYFGFRCLESIEQVLGYDDMVDLAKRFEDILNPDNNVGFKDITTFVAKLLWIGHENACFKDKKPLVFETYQDIYVVIDELGLNESMLLASEGLNSIMNIKGVESKKK